MDLLQRPLTRRELLRAGALAGAGFAAAAVTGCGTPTLPVTGSAAQGKRLTLSWWIDTGYPSPFTFSNLGPGGVVKESMLFDSLIWKDEHGLIPWLAESWVLQDGGRQVVFKIRSNVRWHDGHAFTAADVAFSFRYFADHPYAWADLSQVASARVTDARTVTVTLRAPFIPFLHDVAGSLPMIPQHVWSSVSDPLKFTGPPAVVGTGPFVFGSYLEGQGAYLFRSNDAFFAGKPAFKELAYTMLPEAQQPLALKNGQVDAALSTRYDVQRQFSGSTYHVLKTPPFSVVRLVFNIDRPPFTQLAVRQAVAYALDRLQIGERVIHGDVTVGSAGVIPPGSPWYNPKVKAYPYDLNRARGLLSTIGYDRSRRVQLLAEPDTPDAEIIAAMLGAAGISVDVVTADPKSRTARLRAGEFQMALLKHVGIGGDPDYLRRWFEGTGGNAFELGNRLHSPEFSSLAAEQALTVDSTRRRQMVDRMQVILAEQLPTLPLYLRRFYYLYKPAAWNHWFNTWGGILSGIPLVDNKLALLNRS